MLLKKDKNCEDHQLLSISFNPNEGSGSNSFVKRQPLIRQNVNGKRIMVVDDEEFCISAMKILLKLAGIDIQNQVDFCIHGREAVTKLKKSYELGL